MFRFSSSKKRHTGFDVTRRLDKMGWRSSDTAELSYTEARVPADNLVGAEHTGFAQIAQAFVSERIGLAAQAYSSAQRCLDLTLQWCRDRETFGRPLISRQAVQNTLAEMARRIDVARVYSRHVVERQLAGETNLIAEVCFAKNTAVEAGEWVAHQAVQLFGGMGVHDRVRVERQYRDMRILGIGGGTTEILTGLAAKHLDTRHDRLEFHPRPDCTTYLEAAEAMTAKLAEIDGELAKALGGGGPKYVDRHHARGKLTARERIELLVDADSPFLELCPLAAYGSDFQVGASLVTGIGVVEGVECLLVANDPPTVKGGTSNPPWTLKKILRANQVAFENRLPVISLVESGGADLPTQKEIFIPPGGQMFRDLTRLSAAGIPTIALVFGNSTAGGAYIPRHVRSCGDDQGTLEGVPGRAAAGQDGHRRGVRRRVARWGGRNARQGLGSG